MASNSLASDALHTDDSNLLSDLERIRLLAVIMHSNPSRNLYPISNLPSNSFWSFFDSDRSTYYSNGRVLLGTVVGRYVPNDSIWVDPCGDHARGRLALITLRDRDTVSMRSVLSIDSNARTEPVEPVTYFSLHPRISPRPYPIFHRGLIGANTTLYDIPILPNALRDGDILLVEFSIERFRTTVGVFTSYYRTHRIIRLTTY